MATPVREYMLFVDGSFAEASSRAVLQSIDPSNGEVVAVTARAGVRDARRAISAARRAFDDGDWSNRSPADRAAVLLEVCDRLWARQPEIARLEARDTGQTIRVSSLTVASAVQHARDLVAIASRLRLVEPLPHNEVPLPSQNLLVREPYGVVTAILPVDAPLVAAAWKVFPALAMGNTVVLKPSPESPCSAGELARAFFESGVPAGVLNVLLGGGSDVGEELVRNPLVDRVAFTGSTSTGRRVLQRAAEAVKRVSLALGGKSANILLDDADLDVAVPGSLWAIYYQQGQACSSGSRLLVPRRLADEIVDRVVNAAVQLRVGPTLSWDTDLGPVATERRLQRCERSVRIGREEGAVLACGGHRLDEDDLADGFYYAPTVFTGVRNDMRIAREEIPGPVLSVIPYDDVDEAVRIANDTIYGVAAAVWSRDVPRAIGVARRLRAGTVWVNDYNMLTALAPFGGYRESGLGKELGEAGCLAYTESKHVWVDQGRSASSHAWMPVLGLDRIFGITYE